MEVPIKLFAMLQEQLGPEVVISLPDSVTPSLIKTAMATVYPTAKASIDTARVAINQTFAVENQRYRLTAHDEVAIIPPVSGG
ncbi:MoaD/ThiS family protein [Lentilactobacillus parafarraginis]|nr:MoaD/ThiS family protein [Lentilactobacillus parafarraginis]